LFKADVFKKLCKLSLSGTGEDINPFKEDYTGMFFVVCYTNIQLIIIGGKWLQESSGYTSFSPSITSENIINN